MDDDQQSCWFAGIRAEKDGPHDDPSRWIQITLSSVCLL
jgi:hypothetical protein